MRSTRSQWDSLRRDLHTLAESVAAEIRAYPRPITACDAQFNHLLELRRLLPQELQRLEGAMNSPATTADDFIRSSPCEAELAGVMGSDPTKPISPRPPTEPKGLTP